MNYACRHWAVIFVSIASCATTCAAQTFSHSLPASVEVGKTTRITCFGKGFAKAATLWTSFPATVARVGEPADDSVTFDVTVSADMKVGLHGWRVVTDSGISDVRLCVVDDLPVVAEAGNNNDPKTAQPLPLPVAVDGVLANQQRDFFAIEVAQGQRVSFEAVGDRLGTGFDPLLQIWDPSGHQVVSHDNNEGLGFDFRFSHTFAQAGRYVVELRDTRYQGGGNWVYHLRMGDFPAVQVPYPASAKRGQQEVFTFAGQAGNEVSPVIESLPGDGLIDSQSLAVRGKQGSSWVSVVLDDAPQQREMEPNNKPDQANVFHLGTTLNGRFESARDIDYFRFEGKKGATLTFTGDTRRTGSPADLLFTVLDAAGNQVATADDTGAAEGLLVFKPAADGMYVLGVEDLLGRGGDDFVYRIETTSQPRNFALSTTTDRIVLPKSSLVPLPLSASRTGYAGSVAVGSLGNGELTLDATDLSAGAANIATSLRAGLDVPAGLYTLRLLGTDREKQDLRRGVDLAAVLSPQLGGLTSIPSSVARQVPVLVTERPYFSIESEVKMGYAGRYLSTPLTVTANRDKFFDEEIKLTVSNLPPNVEVAAAAIAKGQRAVDLQVVSKANTPLGTFPVFVSGSSSFQGRDVTVFSEILSLAIQPAFKLETATEAPPLKKGEKVTLVVRATRHPGYTGPIELTASNLPKGVTATAINIEQDKLEATIELAAAADAPAASVKNVVVAGKATVGGQPETANSNALLVSVVEP